MKKKNEELDEELKKIHSNALKQQSERQQSIERLMSLPKRPLINYERKEKPAAETSNQEQEQQQKSTRTKKPPIPSRSGAGPSVRSGASVRSPSASVSKKAPISKTAAAGRQAKQSAAASKSNQAAAAETATATKASNPSSSPPVRKTVISPLRKNSSPNGTSTMAKGAPTTEQQAQLRASVESNPANTNIRMTPTLTEETKTGKKQQQTVASGGQK